MCDILPPRRFSLAPFHGASYEKKREEVLSRPLRVAVPASPPLLSFPSSRDDEIVLEDLTPRTGKSSIVDWNTEFQNAVDEVNSLTMNHSYEKRITAYSRLGKLYQNFVDTATMYGKILISERYLPEECRTFKSCDIGGIAGGEKFLVQNILFKICTDHYGVFGGDEYYAHKLASHEMKGLINIYNYGSKFGLHVPMMCVLVYKGFTMTAMSVVPISDSTLRYGSKDAGDTIHDNPVFSSKLKQVAEELGLRQHKVGREPNTKMLYTPVDMEGHIGTDGRMYLLDFSRLFPPERPVPGTPRFMYLCRLLRPEFVKIYSEIFGPLSSDAYSRFSSGPEAEERDRAEINAATDYLLCQHLPLFLDRFQKFHAIDPFAWLGLLHTHGINYRHLGSFRKLVLRLPPTPNYTPFDTPTLILMAMIARVVKNQLASIMRAQVRAHSQSVPGDQMLKHVAAAFFNLVFGNSRATQNFWDTTLKYKLCEYFPLSLTDEEVQRPEFGTHITKTELICCLFSYTVKLCGLRLRPSATEQFKAPESFDFAEPLDECDIEEIKERVQSMSVAAFAEGYSMQMKAMHKPNHEAKRLYRLSLDKFKTALDMEPGNIQALTQIFVNMVQTDHPKVAESIYHSVVYGKLYDTEFLWRYANFCKSRGLMERAEVHYLYSLDMDPNYAQCLVDYANFLAEQGELHPAHRFFQRAVQAAPTSVDILIAFAIFLYRYLKDPGRSAQFMERAMTSPDFNSTYYPLVRQCAQFFPDLLYAYKLNELFATPDIHNSADQFFSLRSSTATDPPKSAHQLDLQLSYVSPMEG